MKLVATLFVSLAFLAMTAVAMKDPSLRRDRRSVAQFANMLVCMSGRSALSFNDYGCYCGLGGGFGDPVNALDRCCQRHDNCYEGLVKGGFCPSGTDIYQTVYQYSSLNCASSWSVISSAPPQITCESQNNNECQQRICECDRRTAMCMAATPYEQQYLNYDKNTKC